MSSKMDISKFTKIFRHRDKSTGRLVETEAVLYKGLLHFCKERGIRKLSARLVQSPSQDNKCVAICESELHITSDKDPNVIETYYEIGDASPANVNKMIVPHLIRMAATRAKARAMRDALDIGMVSAEELAEDVFSAPQPNGASHKPTEQVLAENNLKQELNNEPMTGNGKATPVQIKELFALVNDVFQKKGDNAKRMIRNMCKVDSVKKITEIQADNVLGILRKQRKQSGGETNVARDNSSEAY